MLQCKQYYILDVSYFESFLDRKLLELCRINTGGNKLIPLACLLMQTVPQLMSLIFLKIKTAREA